MPGDGTARLTGAVEEYFRANPGVELNAVEVLQRARLSSLLGKPIRMNVLRQVLDDLTDSNVLRLRKSGGVRRYVHESRPCRK